MATKKKKALVIVESPAKAKKIASYLGSDYDVRASVGHVRDLPQKAADIPKEFKSESWSNLGVNVEAGFAPLYVVSPEKRKVVKELKELLKNAEELILATDEDREGESIGWHLADLLEPKVPVRRMVFSEITKKAILEALKNTRDLDMNMVEAQETRRVLDRLYGYTLSPLLWKKIRPKLSAGRVQSVAVRVLVAREMERLAFNKAEYWDLTAYIAPQSGSTKDVFEAKLAEIIPEGASSFQSVASGKDFNQQGQLKSDSTAYHLDAAGAKKLAQELINAKWKLEKVDKRPNRRKAAAPFITSTMQQAANNQLNMTARMAMSTAQRLYENGHITYMRTDSTNLSQEALKAAKAVVLDKFSAKHYEGPKQYTKKAKNAQEAHEAIRPAGDNWQTARQLGLSGAEANLYELIWKRSVASQMSDYEFLTTTYTVQAANTRFRASGSVDTFLGFQAVMRLGNAAKEDTLMPDISEGHELFLTPAKSKDAEDQSPTNPTALYHETKPPSRYTEATLVQKLEAEGVGRPSTYASIISTIQDRGYVNKQGSQLVPTFTALAVTKLLENYFPNLVDLKFTAEMEQSLDDISNGEAERKPYLEGFYLGESGLDGQVKAKEESIDPREACTLNLRGISPSVRVGKFGPYLELQEANGDIVNASLPAEMTPGDLDDATAMKLIEMKKAGPKALGMHPEEGAPIYIKVGPFGPYLQMGEDKKPEDDEAEFVKPKRVSIPKHIELEDVDLDLAIKFLSLPRRIGHHPEDGKVVNAGIGRFGAYVQHAGKYKSLDKEDDVLTIEMDRAVELLKQVKGRQAATPLKEFGNFPDTEEPVAIFEGKYGPYIKSGKINVTVPKDNDPQSMTLEEAVKMIIDKAEKTNKKHPGQMKKKAAKKAPKKKATPKSAAAKSTNTMTTEKKASKKTTSKKTATKKKATQKKKSPAD